MVFLCVLFHIKETSFVYQGKRGFFLLSPCLITKLQNGIMIADRCNDWRATDMGILLGNTSEYSAGDVFYYRSKKRMFGCVILFHQQDYYLIALSEEIMKTTKTICCDDVLQSVLYSIAWFSDVEMLLPQRLHRLGTILLDADYTNRAGLLIDDNGVILKNVGQSGTWAHTFRSFAIRDIKVQDVLNTKYVPKTRR